MNLIVLSLTNLFCRSALRLWLPRRCAAALLGTLGEAALFLLLGYGAVFVLLGAFFLVPLMVLLAFGFVGVRVFFRRILVSWLSVVILEGMVSAVYNLTGIRSVHLYVAVLVLFAARFLVRILLGSLGRERREFLLTLFWHGRSVRCMGLYDSGNLLTMPLSGEPVHIAAPQILRELFGEEEGTPQTISYHALGTDCGQLAVYRLDRMEIRQRKGKKILEQPWVGSAQESLLAGKPYRVILHAGVMENE